MKKILAAVALSLVFGGVITHAAGTPPTPNDTVVKRNAEVVELTASVYPAFVMLGGGSGVCISEDGYFITNHHVFSAAAAPSQMVAKMAGNSRRFVVDAVGADPRGDIVLGKLRLKDGETVPHVELGDSDAVQIGDLCLAIGNPFLLNGNGSEPTVTFGTVTATHRFQGGYNDCIEIDTAINPGNSGGPSFNINGEMIGINGRNISSHGKRFNTGAGFAIPSNQIKNMLVALKAESGGAYVVRHGLVGGLNLDLSSQDGAKVESVDDDSDASDAGFKPGDVITAVDGKTAFNSYRAIGIIETKPRGSTFTFTVKRDNKMIELTAVNSVPTESGQFGTVPRPDDVARKDSRSSNPFARMSDPFKLPPMKSSLGFRGTYNTDRKVGGYVITEIKPGSPLADTGMAEGDILVKVNGRHIQYFADLHDILIATAPGTEVTVTWLHNGEENTATVKTVK